jgi:hypothetical protein
VDPTTCNLLGGHCNFAILCDGIDCPDLGRYDNGIHIECASGGYDCDPSIDPLVVHDDTVSPWLGVDFPPSAVFTTDFWRHGIVDLFGGTFFVGAFPQ